MMNSFQKNVLLPFGFSWVKDQQYLSLGGSGVAKTPSPLNNTKIGLGPYDFSQLALQFWRGSSERKHYLFWSSIARESFGTQTMYEIIKSPFLNNQLYDYTGIGPQFRCAHMLSNTQELVESLRNKRITNVVNDT